MEEKNNVAITEVIEEELVIDDMDDVAFGYIARRC